MLRGIVIILVAASLTTCTRVVGDVSAEPIEESKMDRPSTCERFRREYRDDEWDEVTETFPENIAWNECMGVALVQYTR